MEPNKWQVDTKINVVATAIWLIVVIGGLLFVARDPLDLDLDMRIIAGAGGIATGVVYHGLGQSLALTRYRWVGVVGGLLSVALIFVPLSVSSSWITLGVIWAVILVVSGSLAYRQVMTKLSESAA